MIDQIFTICCNIITILSQFLNISYAACNILIFIYILPALYLILSISVGISGFFKKNKLFGILCIIFSLYSSLYTYELLFYMITEFSLTTESFNQAVLILQQNANNLNCSYQEINILYFIIVPIIYISFLTFLIIKK